MAVYDYLCDACGPFTATRPMAECDESHDCPECGAAARRALLTAPHFSTMSSEHRRAHAANERSSHAPRTSAEFKAAHGAGCSCCSGQKSLVKRGKGGAKSFPASRPWMISH